MGLAISGLLINKFNGASLNGAPTRDTQKNPKSMAIRKKESEGSLEKPKGHGNLDKKELKSMEFSKIWSQRTVQVWSNRS